MDTRIANFTLFFLITSMGGELYFLTSSHNVDIVGLLRSIRFRSIWFSVILVSLNGKFSLFLPLARLDCGLNLFLVFGSSVVMLLGKWLWRYMKEEDSLWRRVIRSKYGDNGFGRYPSRPKRSLWA